MSQAFGQLFAWLLGVVVTGLVLVGLVITVFILDIVAHLRAGKTSTTSGSRSLDG